MNKRGQVVVFIIIGIVILAGFGFSFYILSDFSKKYLRSDEKIIQEEALRKGGVKEYIENCMKLEGAIAINKTFSDISFLYPDLGSLKYNKKSYPYLRDYDNISGPIQEPFSRDDFSIRIIDLMDFLIDQCIVPDVLDRLGYLPIKREKIIEVVISEKNIDIKMIYGLKAKTGESIDIIDELFVSIDTYAPYLIDLLAKILYDEDFDVFGFLKDYWRYLEIEKHTPYPDVTYQININDRTIIDPDVRFALKGEDVAAVVESYNPVKKSVGLVNIPVVLT